VFTVFALLFLNNLDKSQGAAAEYSLLQITEKLAWLQAEMPRPGLGKQIPHKNIFT
jgi:hypothetical protein